LRVEVRGELQREGGVSDLVVGHTLHRIAHVGVGRVLGLIEPHERAERLAHTPFTGVVEGELDRATQRGGLELRSRRRRPAQTGERADGARVPDLVARGRLCLVDECSRGVELLELLRELLEGSDGRGSKCAMRAR